MSGEELKAVFEMVAEAAEKDAESRMHELLGRVVISSTQENKQLREENERLRGLLDQQQVLLEQRKSLIKRMADDIRKEVGDE